MAFIYKTDKKTGKTYRITAAGWDSSSNPGFTGSREVPVISWTPQTLSGSTSLTPDQLNAIATVNGNQISGSFAYFDIMGNYISVGHDLPVGDHKIICNFYAQDPYKYEDIKSSAIIKVE